MFIIKGTTPTVKILAEKEWLDEGATPTVSFKDKKGRVITFNPTIEEETEETANENGDIIVTVISTLLLCNFTQIDTLSLDVGSLTIECYYLFPDGRGTSASGGRIEMYNSQYFPEADASGGIEGETECPIDLETKTPVVITGGSGFTYTNLEPTTIKVGGIDIGTTFDNESLKSILDRLFYEEFFPTLTEPSVTSFFNVDLVEVGVATEIIFGANASRGSINPAYTTNGFRAGLPTEYLFSVSGSDGFSDLVESSIESSSLKEQQSITFNFNQPTTLRLSSSVIFLSGEQPKTNFDNDFGTAYGGGKENATVLSLPVVLPYFATTEFIDMVTKTASIIEDYIQVDMVKEEGLNKQTIEFPAFYTVTGIQVLNEISGQYDNISTSSFTETTFDKNISGLTFAYKRLVNNTITIGERTLRFFVSK